MIKRSVYRSLLLCLLLLCLSVQAADRYVDFSNSTGTLTGTWTFTNSSTSVTAAADGDAVNQLANNDYVRVSNGVQWYKVTARPNADTITITPAFQQGTVTDTASISLYNSETGATFGAAFAHHNQATTDEVRSAGDIIRTRGGLTYTYAGAIITIDEDGSVNNYIVLKGNYDGVDDPWSDGVVARPVFDFADTTAHIQFSNDNYWKVWGFEVIRSTNTSAAIRVSGSTGITIEDCKIHNNNAGAGGRGVHFSDLFGDVSIIDCELYDNKDYNLELTRCGIVLISGCIMRGGTVGTSFGIRIVEGAIVYLKNTTFGVTNEHSSADISIATGSVVYGRNVKLASTTQVGSITSAGNEYSVVSIEDNEQISEAYKNWQFSGTVEKDDGETPPGGSGWAMRGDETSNCGLEQPLYIVGNFLRGVPVFLDGTEQTITVNIKALDADWTDGGGSGGRPDNSELYMELEYSDGASSWIRIASTEVCTDDTYTSFTVTITPNAAGPAYIKVLLLIYDISGGGTPVYVDPVPIINMEFEYDDEFLWAA